MALTTYCGYDEVRSALGVDDDVLSDAVLRLPVYEIGLVRELNKVSTSLPAAFSTVLDIQEEDRSDSQQDLADTTHLFCVYAVAKQVGASLGMFAPKDIGDGKSTLSRFSDSPYKDALERIDLLYGQVRDTLVETLKTYTGVGTITASTVPFLVFAKSSRGSDPVTGT